MGETLCLQGVWVKLQIEVSLIRDLRTHREEAPFVGGVGVASVCGSISSDSRRQTGDSPIQWGVWAKFRSAFSADNSRQTGEDLCLWRVCGKFQSEVPSNAHQQTSG
ncbi:unnamed protein product [Rangifer tarandus platyrhynchus]|uniref:Uncharacterized protein n=2 Tax=Rangifer tarandus platyrhynchus TaxID=3082113 RepID=A0ABN9AC22_RANTA|nr:unnamed protein product [Rangifer tarandus platyrhynchus]